MRSSYFNNRYIFFIQTNNPVPLRFGGYFFNHFRHKEPFSNPLNENNLVGKEYIARSKLHIFSQELTGILFYTFRENP